MVPLRQAKSQALSIVLYVLGFLLFWEWLRPLSSFTFTGNIDYFVGFAAFSFLLTYLRFPFWITFPIKIIAIIYALHMLFFYNSSIFNTLWLDYFIEDFKDNVIFLFDGNWSGMTDLFRSLLFFILLWIISYLMRYWVLQARRLFLFFFVTILYLTIIDTFTLYHADMAIVRTMIIGLVLLGLLRVIRIQEKEKVTFERRKLPISWLVALAAIIILTTTVGYAAPKFGPQWPDPVPFIQKAANGYEEYNSDKGAGNGLGQVQQKIGYDDDDSSLGGGFIMDDTPVFNTIGAHTHYWRVNTKNYYTGKGWENKPEGESSAVQIDDLSNRPSLDLYEERTKVEEATDQVEFVGDQFPQLIYGGEVTKISKLDQKSAQIQLNDASGKFEPYYHGRHITLKEYTLDYQYPSFSIPDLRKVTSLYQDPQDIKRNYLQLPDELPTRVRDLAKQITQNSDNRYDQAEDIVQYLRGSEFTYETDNVAKPSGNTDYVDQFLFETKVGYCDNFSSSMVVLLRAVGIPARWVKGFSQGTYSDTIGDNQYQYVVKNSDAHSWVEVYFPGSGWVPFEPTKSFDNIYTFNYGESSDSESSATKASAEKTQTQQDEDQQKATQEESQERTSTSSPVFDFHITLSTLWKIIAGLVVLLVIVAVGLFAARKKWLPGYLLKKYSKRTDDEALEPAFKQLFNLLGLYGYKRKPDQTLREYAARIDRSFGITDMRRLITKYEENRYFHSQPNQWSDCKESWENIIKKLRG